MSYLQFVKVCFGQSSDSENDFGELHRNQGNVNSCHNDTALRPYIGKQYQGL